MKESITRCLTICQLFSKEVINTATGERLGYITDAEIDADRGIIRYLIVPVPCKNPFSKGREVRKFQFDDILKIGSDTILVKSTFPCPLSKKSIVN